MSNDREKTALAAGALGLGTVGGVAAVSGGDRAVGFQKAPSQVLIFAYDYHPNLSFGVGTRLQQQAVDDILGQSVGENGDQIVNDPTEYNGYIAQYQPDDGMGEYTLVFVRDVALDVDATYQFAPGDVTYFDTDVNLLQVGLDTGDGEETAEEEGETTPEGEETTPEDGATTPDDGGTPDDGATTPDGEGTTTTEEKTPTTTEETGPPANETG